MPVISSIPWGAQGVFFFSSLIIPQYHGKGIISTVMRVAWEIAKLYNSQENTPSYLITASPVCYEQIWGISKCHHFSGQLRAQLLCFCTFLKHLFGKEKPPSHLQRGDTLIKRGQGGGGELADKSKSCNTEQPQTVLRSMKKMISNTSNSRAFVWWNLLDLWNK